ncbi:hypothetical protein CRM22_003201, partial [Opisthorchis felineus]
MTEKSESEANPNPTTSEATPAKQEEAPVEVHKYRSVVLGAYGGTKHVRVESDEVKAPGKNEIEVTVEACSDHAPFWEHTYSILPGYFGTREVTLARASNSSGASICLY